MALMNYWIIVDLIIMAFTLPYTYISQIMMITGEVIKNTFTLHQVQKNKLKERRAFISENPNQIWKSYFAEIEKSVILQPFYKGIKKIYIVDQ